MNERMSLGINPGSSFSRFQKLVRDPAWAGSFGTLGRVALGSFVSIAARSGVEIISVTLARPRERCSNPDRTERSLAEVSRKANMFCKGECKPRDNRTKNGDFLSEV